MIYTSVKVTIKRESAKLNRDIIIYRGDKNIEVQFEIIESVYNQYKFNTTTNAIEYLGASYGQLAILGPNSSVAISDITETKDGRIVFTIPAEMADERSEVGAYDFQIILYDESMNSKVTLPPIVGGIIVKEPVCSETTD